MEKKISYEELKTKLNDYELFIRLLPLFESMSKRGKDATLESLMIYMIEEV